MVKCPNCGLINPPEAQFCDCGFALETRKTSARSRSDATLTKNLIEFLALLAILGAIHLFFATPFDTVIRVDLRKCSNPLLRSILFDPTLKNMGYEKLAQQIDVSSLGLSAIGKGKSSVEPPFLILSLVHWGSFLDERHIIDEEAEVSQSINWMLVGIEAALGLLVAFIPLFKWPAKLVRAYLNGSD
jgi:hypothetical protein